MREAGRLINMSASFINHYEHGRLDIDRERIPSFVEAYGYSMPEFEDYKSGKPIPSLGVKDECIALLNRLDENRLRTVHAVLMGFIQ
jgi:hypothetical protein